MTFRKVIPRQIATSLRKAIPAGDFDATALRLRQGFRIDRRHNSHKVKNSWFTSRTNSADCKQKNSLKKKNQMMCEK
jgi:hypothetical protein